MHRWSRRTIALCAVALLLLGTVYQVKGNLDLVFGTTPGDAVDLRSRDYEQAHFARGENPFEFMTASQPPWAYPFGMVLTWPQWPEVRWYFAVLNALALAFLMWFAGAEARGAPTEARLLLMGAVMAFGGSSTATQVGQVSIICTALLAGALVCDRQGRPWCCGLLVALAMIKPTIAAPFALALLMTGRFTAAAGAAAYGAVASGIAWIVTGTSPLQMLRQLNEAAALYIGDGTVGLADALASVGASPASVALTPLLVAIPAAALMMLSRASLPLAFAIAAVAGRLWTYHKSYDDVMLVFVLVPLGVLGFGPRRSVMAAAAFVLFGLLEWLPGRVLALPAIQLLQLMAWPLSLAVLLRLDRRFAREWTWTVQPSSTTGNQPAT